MEHTITEKASPNSVLGGAERKVVKYLKKRTLKERERHHQLAEGSLKETESEVDWTPYVVLGGGGGVCGGGWV